MSTPITGREHYQWHTPIAAEDRSVAHAFIPLARHSVCLKMERYDYAPELLRDGEPKRVRCDQCKRIIGRKGNENMVEETE